MTRSLNLDELGKLVEEVAREQNLEIRVVGVTPTEGSGSYAEVMVSRHDDGMPLSIGLRRDERIDELRRKIASTLSEE